jgi:predicted CoA-binding protein
MNITEIKEFLSLKPLAIVGISSSGKKFGASVFRTMRDAGYELVPINPKMQVFDGVQCFPNLASLNPPPQGVIIITKPKDTLKVLEECLKVGVKTVWIQQGAESAKAIAFCQKNGIKAFTGNCILLFTKVFPHTLHLFFLKLFGKIK